MSLLAACCCVQDTVPPPPVTHCKFCGATQIHHVVVGISYTPCPTRACSLFLPVCGLQAASQTFPGAANGTHLLPAVAGETGTFNCRYCKPIVLASAVSRGITSGCGVTSDPGCGTAVNGTTSCGPSIAWANALISPGSIEVAVGDYSVTTAGYRCPDGSCGGICTQVYTKTLAGFTINDPDFTAFCNGSTIVRTFNLGTCSPTDCAQPPGLFSSQFGNGTLTVNVTRGF